MEWTLFVKLTFCGLWLTFGEAAQENGATLFLNFFRRLHPQLECSPRVFDRSRRITRITLSETHKASITPAPVIIPRKFILETAFFAIYLTPTSPIQSSFHISNCKQTRFGAASRHPMTPRKRTFCKHPCASLSTPFFLQTPLSFPPTLSRPVPQFLKLNDPLPCNPLPFTSQHPPPSPLSHFPSPFPCLSLFDLPFLFRLPSAVSLQPVSQNVVAILH